MTSIRPMTFDDLLNFNNVNLDHLTETFTFDFYLEYFTRWPELCSVVEAPNGQIMGYYLGKVEGEGDDWHGHVSAVTVDPEFRRMGLARKMMNELEEVSERHKGYFVDLFVRASNSLAVGMYKTLGFDVYRRILGYYSGADDGEDGLDMRKSLTADPEKKKMIPLKRPIKPEELEWH
eukprot:TRINITY_DN778121_c0_g1_i1.p1 TRINITY_DN778121_c0_g1~~TRINITY_DN778121_c0_g1_i1.p1  ORF type:complete len:198 (-),score=47.96 TRINITY_DN778121_c0_g1_i1:125-655(-)